MPVQINLDAKQNIPPDQVYEKFVLDRPGRIILVGRHLSTKTSIRCLIRSISLYGAELEVSPSIEVPKHFFMEILGIHDEIGCTVIRREEEKLTVGFNMLMDAEFLHHVVRLSFELGN